MRNALRAADGGRGRLKPATARRRGAEMLILVAIAAAAALGTVAAGRHYRNRALWIPVDHVVDGDTLVLGSGDTVRVLGVDTPETRNPGLESAQPFGPEATARTRELVVRGVRLEAEGPDRDHYGRLLRHVFVPDGLLAEILVREGLGKATPRAETQRYADRLERAEDAARVEDRGIWGFPGATPLPVFATAAPWSGR